MKGVCWLTKDKFASKSELNYQNLYDLSIRFIPKIIHTVHVLLYFSVVNYWISLWNQFVRNIYSKLQETKPNRPVCIFYRTHCVSRACFLPVSLIYAIQDSFTGTGSIVCSSLPAMQDILTCFKYDVLRKWSHAKHDMLRICSNMLQSSQQNAEKV